MTTRDLTATAAETAHPNAGLEADAGLDANAGLNSRTARVTGLAYLGLAVSGAVGFLAIRSQLYVPHDAIATAANLVGHEPLARLGIAADLAVVLTQVLAALGFFRLFRSVDAFAAAALAAFGFVNAVAVLIGTAFSATALTVALDGPAPGGDRAQTAQLLYELNGAAWGVGGLFFGLWLIPMGWLARRSRRMPRPLAWVLIGGGIGYIVGAFVTYLAPGAPALAQALTVPASVGEFWMMGFLLLRGAGVPRTPRTLDHG
jgi:hypothetical protein